MSAKKLSQRVWGRLRWLAHWRCLEPVVVIESDDWGLDRVARPEEVARYGTPSEWAYETSETVEDLEELFAALERRRDPYGNPACLTANFIVSNPDYDAIRAARFEEYIDQPLDQTAIPGMLAAYREGMNRGVFEPAYHGRRHLSPAPWLEDLQQNAPGAKALFDLRCAGGLSLCEGQGWRYHSEYIDWRRRRFFDSREVAEFLHEGVATFRRVFGRGPSSTISPNYLFGNSTCEAWARAGIQCVQGAGYRLLVGPAGESLVWAHYLGEANPAGLVYLTRPVKFEPRPQRPMHRVAGAVRAMREMFAGNVPAVIDTHRINYAGGFRREALSDLDVLLGEAVRARALFLSTTELGEAIRSDGWYHDRRTQERRRLTPISARGAASARALLALRRPPEAKGDRLS